jgi:hypothetical protein
MEPLVKCRLNTCASRLVGARKNDDNGADFLVMMVVVLANAMAGGGC